MSDGGWGYFGPKTVAAVNAYKEDNDLGNDGKYHGVVGKETWNSLGLLSREQKDIDAGVELRIIGNQQYLDISRPVENAVIKATPLFENHINDNLPEKLQWFAQQVNDRKNWDIKSSRKTWAETLGVSEASCTARMIFKGRIVTPEDMGNITYGYLGAALGLSEELLYGGSFLNHFSNHWFKNMRNEEHDRKMVKIGMDWYNGADIEVKINAKNS